MKTKITPMLRVPDVAATVKWYETVGFEVTSTHIENDKMDWAEVSLAESGVMFNAGGKPSVEPRREVDLYVRLNGIDGLFEKIKGSVEVVEAPHETFYGMREFVIRDLNGFWITFGQPM